MSFVKALLRNTPPTINVLGECDVPFPLPTEEEILDKIFFKKSSNVPTHYKQRREIYRNLEDVFSLLGLDGNACVKRIMCEAETLLPSKGESLFGDLLITIFNFRDSDIYEDHNYKDYCNLEVFEKCEIPLLASMFHSLTSNEDMQIF